MERRNWLIGLAAGFSVMAALACSLPSSLPSISTATPTLTATATATPTASTTPTPSQTPTPAPSDRFEAADQAYINGDWEAALRMFGEITEITLHQELGMRAKIGAGKCLLALERYDALLEAMDQLLASPSSGEISTRAHLLKAWAFENLGDDRNAAEAYQQVLDSGVQALRGFVLDWRGDALWEIGEYEQAGDAYQQALFNEPTSGYIQVEIKLAGTLEDRGDFESAINRYQSIYDATDEEYLKAFMDRLMGQAMMRLGMAEEAYTRYLDAVEQFPQYSDSYLALVELVNAGVPVSEFDRGLVDYYAGQYSLALAAFNRYEALAPDDHTGNVHYFKGLTLRALGEYELALKEWDRLIDEHPEDEFLADAWDEQVTTLWAYQDRYTEAVDRSEAFAVAYPDNPQSAVFLFDAGRVAERDGDLQRAAELFRRAASRYPQVELAFRAQFLAGITLYRLSEMNDAQTAFLAAIEVAGSGEERAAAQLWVGKTHQELGEHEAAQQAYKSATSEEPNGYYGLRAQERLLGDAPFTTAGRVIFPTRSEIDDARQAAVSFLQNRYPLAEGETYAALRMALRADPGFQRADILWSLGLYAEAKSEFEALRSEYKSDAHRTFLLMEELLARDLYQPAIYAAFDLIEFSGYTSSTAPEAPVYFNYVRFGPYFDDLILSAAEQKNLDGLFVLSLVRQESLFESFATSYAAAQGLMQIIPSTAAELVAKEGWPPDFTNSDLYRPIVSIRLGVRYLADQRDLFDGDLYAALAAYNAGPGNSLAWRRMAEEDQDLFLEVIRLRQPQDYIRVIYWAYSHYHRLYVQP